MRDSDLTRDGLLISVALLLLSASLPAATCLTPARFEIVELWITPYGYEAGSVKVTKIFTDQQYWFGATIRKYGEESAKATYRWTFDNLGSVEDHESVQSGEVLEYPIASQFGGGAATIGYQIVLFWPGVSHTFGFTIEWQSASGGAGTVSSSMSFEVEKPPITETTAAEQTTFSGVSTAFPGWTTAQTIANESPPSSTEVILIVAVLVLAASVVILWIRRAPQRMIPPSTVLCVECGMENPTTNEYCGKCGKRLVARPIH